ncbi:hypothetical protein CIPAW_16G011500 [Carya illinoinensis]|uniref:Uncharacterized protein n=1 Tax=Carya illinoinensis TaxID=32201 RepID=A0A8T1N5D5_CARIL|nr:hypothetical protein CIPAW_16G011500 [Carya illinoinensis]
MNLRIYLTHLIDCIHAIDLFFFLFYIRFFLNDKLCHASFFQKSKTCQNFSLKMVLFTLHHSF